MKKILFSLLIILVCNEFTEAQVATDSTKRLTDRELGLTYLTKSKKQRSAGFALMGLGIAGMVGGLVGAESDIWSNTAGYEIIFLLGLGCTITSFPLFNSASKNRGRAEILLRYENMPVSNIVPGRGNMPSFGVAFSIR